MELSLANARVLVTGGSSNIGRAIVHGFAREHARVLLCDVDRPQSERVATEARQLGAAEVDFAIADLTRPGAGREVVDRMVQQWDGIDVLVNNVGWTRPAFFGTDTDRADWQRIIDINLFAAIEASQAALAPMRSVGGGSLVFIASDAAFGQIRQGIYGAAKAGIVALAKTIAKEHGRHQIRANVIAPGLVLPADADAVGTRSLWSAGTDAIFDDRQLASVLDATPLGRLTMADDIANAVIWFSADRVARQVTGQVISISGGFAMP